MKLLDRYLLFKFIGNWILSLLGLVGLFLFQSLFHDLYEHRFSLEQILIYHGLRLPQIFLEMNPPSVLLGTVLTFSSLSKNHELIAYFVAGISLKRMASCLFGVLIFFSFFILVAQDRFLPFVHRVQTTYYWREMQNKPDFFLDIKRDKIWYRSKNMIYNLQRFDTLSQTIYGMSIYTFDKTFQLTEVISAKTATFSKKSWTLHRGTVTTFTQENPFPSTQDFEKKNNCNR